MRASVRILAVVVIVASCAFAGVLAVAHIGANPDENGRRTPSRWRSIATVDRGQLLVSAPDGLRELSLEITDDGVLDNSDREIVLGSEALTPTYSPDGKRVAYIAASDGGTELMLARSDGSGVTPLTRTAEYRETGPTWSPNGGSIAYERTDSSGRTELWVVDPDGVEPRVIAQGDDTYLSPAWDPDGSHLVYVKRSTETGASDLFECEVESGVTSQLTKTPDVNEGQPAYSPDGLNIAYTVATDQSLSNTDEPPSLTSAIYILREGQDPTPLETAPVNVLKLQWISDERLALVDFREPGRVYAISVSSPKQEATLAEGKGLATFDWRQEG